MGNQSDNDSLPDWLPNEEMAELISRTPPCWARLFALPPRRWRIFSATGAPGRMAPS